MSIHIIRADLSQLPFYVDFIVNTANPEPKVGNGLDKYIHEKAGPEMLEMRKQIGQISPGDIAITNAFNLNAKKVIHAVSVAWTDGFHDEPSIVQKCYHKSLAAAADYMHNHQQLSVSIAMPIIGTGIYKVPLDVSLSIAISESTRFALQYNMEIFIVILSESVVTTVKKAFPVEECVTYQEEVYIYNAASGAYEKRTQNEVERIIMARYRDFIREYGNGTLIEKVYKLLLKEPQIVRNDVPVSDPTKIAFANCTLDLQTGCTGPHSPAYVVTFALNCDLARASHQSEECPAFDKFLYDITGGDELLIKRIWEFVGYCLTQDTNAKVYFVLQGVPDSGKSLLCNLVMDYFPEDKVSSLNVHSLKEHFALDNLESVALCVSPDLPASALDPKSASSIKQLTGNDRVSAAVKYKRNTQFRFEGKLILATNYPLLTQEPDDAFMQRAVVIPFFHSIPKEKQDGSLLDQLKAEKPAIASKALEAYIRLRKNHYKFSGDYAINSSLMFPDDLFGSSDITPFVYNFLKNFYEKDPNGMVAISSAYELFSQWVSNQFTEKMFSSAFQRFSEELYGAEHTCSYHNGEFRNARSSMKGIRLKVYSYPNV